MQKITKGKIIKIQTLISKLDLRDEKEDLVRRFSHIRSASVAALSGQEADRLLAFLEGNTPPTDDTMDRMRKKMLYLGYMMGYDEPRYDHQRHLPPGQINYQNVDAWCKSSRSAVCKPLHAMDRQQLSTALTQFEQMYKKAMKTINK